MRVGYTSGLIVGLVVIGSLAILPVGSAGAHPDHGRFDHGPARHHHHHHHAFYRPAPERGYYAPPPVYYNPPQAYYAPPPVFAAPGLTIRLP